MNPSKIYKLVLSSGIEDYTGLWEILWELRELFPDVPESERREAAHAAIKELLARRWILLYQRNRVGEKEQQLSLEQAYQQIENSISWLEPKADSTQVLIGTTEQGAHAYRDLW